MPYALCPMPYALYQACTALLLRKAIYLPVCCEEDPPRPPLIRGENERLSSTPTHTLLPY